MATIQQKSIADESAPRLRLDVTVSGKGWLTPAFCADIHAGGMSVRTCRDMPLGTEVRVRFVLPGVGRVKLLGRVVVQTPSSGARIRLVELKFTDAQSELAPLRKWVEQGHRLCA